MAKVLVVIATVILIIGFVAGSSWVAAKLAEWVLSFWHIHAPFYGLWALLAVGPVLLKWLIPTGSSESKS